MAYRIHSLRVAGRGRPSGGLILAAILLTVMLLGCSRSGDFGREKADAASGRFADADPLATGGVAQSSFPPTDDERELRALAAGLLAPSFSAGRPALAGGGIDSPFPVAVPLYDGASYEAYLLAGPASSTASRYARLTDDIRNDLVRLDPFFLLARRVADIDHKRERSLPYVTDLSPHEFTNARRRVRENMLLISEVHRALLARAAMYRFALERLVISQPSPLAADAERLWAELDRRVAAIQVVASRARGGPTHAHPRVTKP